MERPPQRKDKKENEPEPEKMSRRKFLGGAIGTAASTGVLATGYKLLQDYQPEADVESPLAPERSPVPESRPERFGDKERFERESTLYAQQYQLAYDEVLFFDQDGVMVGEPVQFEEFIVDRTRINENGEEEIFRYRLTPGPLNEAGLATEGIAGEWLQFVRARLQEQYPDREIVGQLNNSDFVAAYQKANNESVRAAVSSGEIRRYSDLVKHFAEQPASDSSHRSRLEFLQQEITFADDVPEPIQAVLRQQVVGLAALESKFEPGLTNVESGATGIL